MPKQSSTSCTNLREVAATNGDSKSASEKEIELLKHRVEMAENNFSALVGRLQDFRTSLRSEIRIMPDAVDSDGLSNLSAAMETTIDDAALFLRNISDGLKQSRTNWEIHCGQIEKAKAKEGSKASGRQEFQMLSEGPVDTKGKGKRKAEDVDGDDEEEFFDRPCLRCAATLKRCEKQRNGGVCMECKAKKTKCSNYSK